MQSASEGFGPDRSLSECHPSERLHLGCGVAPGQRLDLARTRRWGILGPTAAPRFWGGFGEVLKPSGGIIEDVAFWPRCWMPKQPWALRRPAAHMLGGTGHWLCGSTRRAAQGERGGRGERETPKHNPNPPSGRTFATGASRGGSMVCHPTAGQPHLGPQGCWGHWGMTGSAAGGTDGTGSGQMVPAPDRQPQDGGAV